MTRATGRRASQDNRDRKPGKIAAGARSVPAGDTGHADELSQVVQCFDLRKQVGELRGFKPLTPSAGCSGCIRQAIGRSNRGSKNCWTTTAGRQRTSTDDTYQVRHAAALVARAGTWLRDERAISQAAAFLDEPQGMRAVLDAIDRLADGFVVSSDRACS